MLDAMLLGILQGLTEFLPISSSGHLVLGEHFLGMAPHGSQGLLLEVVLHLGTLLAVVVAYRQDLLRLAASLWPGTARRMEEDQRRRHHRLLLAMVVATLPAALVGLTMKGPIEQVFGNPRLVALLLMGTAAILFVGDRLRQGNRLAEQLGLPRALGVGAVQALAILPGISRSGSTIVAGLLCGLRPVEAARFSFLISVPAVSGAALLEARDLWTGEAVLSTSPAALGAGFICSAVVGYLALQWLLIAVRHRSLTYFACYCFVVGLAALLLGSFA
ncbi:MAG: undecaprenyl-diphosphate phosphatase [bacterium]|nr:undecaprenyl-diphosphate phosphatase [bacterium]